MIDYVSIPYVIGADYGPIPPWVDGLRILIPDDGIGWKGKPGTKRKYVDVFKPASSNEERRSLISNFIPPARDIIKNYPTWEISLNSYGFRDKEHTLQKSANSFRIVCLGDSWTFGANVAQDDAYPQQLNAIFDREFSYRYFEVFNLGVLGYTSYNGLQLLKQELANLKPDVVVIGFAMNDFNTFSESDVETDRVEEYKNTQSKLHQIFKTFFISINNNLELFKLLDFWAVSLKWKPIQMASFFDDGAYNTKWHDEYNTQINKLEPWFQNILLKYQENILNMINLSRSMNSEVVLLYPEFWQNSPFLKVLKYISEEENLPLIDASSLIAKQREVIEQKLENRLGLTQHQRDSFVQSKEIIDVIFRVYANDYKVAKSIYITGNHAKLGNIMPNVIKMYDDGTHGDQVPKDNVWSYLTTLPIGTQLSYVYTNSGDRGKWEGLDVPDIRSVIIDWNMIKNPLYLPIDTFGEIYMKADPWHTNAIGYHLIAKEVFDKIVQSNNFNKYLKNLSREDIVK